MSCERQIYVCLSLSQGKIESITHRRGEMCVKGGKPEEIDKKRGLLRAPNSIIHDSQCSAPTTIPPYIPLKLVFNRYYYYILIVFVLWRFITCFNFSFHLLFFIFCDEPLDSLLSRVYMQRRNRHGIVQWPPCIYDSFGLMKYTIYTVAAES